MGEDVVGEERHSDERLVSLARAGDEQAFEQLHARYRPDLLAFCRHLTGQREDAEDAVQYTFFVTYREIVETDRALDLRPWLFTVARNRCNSLLRRRRARPTARPHEVMGAPEQPPPDEIELREELRDLFGDLQALPEQQREALLLSELADLRHAEIARVIGVSPAKVKALVFQARESLSCTREARDADCEDIRTQLATLSGGALRRRRLRRHLRTCEACSAYEHALAERRKGIAAFVPTAAGSTVVGGGGGLGGGAMGALLGTGLGGATQAAIAVVAVVGTGVALGGLAGGPVEIAGRASPGERPEQRAEVPHRLGSHPPATRAHDSRHAPTAHELPPLKRGDPPAGVGQRPRRRSEGDAAGPADKAPHEVVLLPPSERKSGEDASWTPAREEDAGRSPAHPGGGAGRDSPAEDMRGEGGSPQPQQGGNGGGGSQPNQGGNGGGGSQPQQGRNGGGGSPPGQVRREDGSLPPGQARRQEGAPPPGQVRKEDGGPPPGQGRNPEGAPPPGQVRKEEPRAPKPTPAPGPPAAQEPSAEPVADPPAPKENAGDKGNAPVAPPGGGNGKGPPNA